MQQQQQQQQHGASTIELITQAKSRLRPVERSLLPPVAAAALPPPPPRVDVAAAGAPRSPDTAVRSQQSQSAPSASVAPSTVKNSYEGKPSRSVVIQVYTGPYLGPYLTSI